MNNNEKLIQARNLYFNTTLKQSEIADLVGVSQKTISLYISQNNWKLLKKRAHQLPGLFVEQMNAELQELNSRIVSRPEGKRFPTSQEAEVRRKILHSLAAVKERQSAGAHIEAFMNLMSYIADRNVLDARLLSGYALEFLQGKMNVPNSPKFATYTLPDNI